MIKSIPAGWTRQQVTLVLACALAAFCCKLLLAWNTYGTNDVLTWEVSAEREARGEAAELYRHGNPFPTPDGRVVTQVYNHPPPAFYALRAWRYLEERTGVPLRFWMRATDAVADLCSLAVVGSLNVGSPAILALIAISPVSILVAGFHGNTDPILMLFLLLSVLWAQRKNPLLAGLCFAAALDVKVVAILLGSALLFHFPSARQRLQFAGVACTAVLISWAPYLWTDPRAVISSVLGYGSVWGYWGISSIGNSMSWRFPRTQTLVLAYQNYGAYLLLVLVSILGWWLQREPIYRTAALVFFIFLVLSPGFGVQYLDWLVPWLAVLPLGMAVLQQAVCGVFLAAVYTFWSGGFPWYYANSFQVGMWRSSTLRGLEALAWLSVCLCLWAIGRMRIVGAKPLREAAKLP